MGDSGELSLADLIQVKGQSPTTCRILVQGRRGPGEIFLDRGTVIRAEYDGLHGGPAAHALLAEQDVVYRATSDVPLAAPNMEVEHRALLLQAAVADDEGRRAPPPLPPAERAVAGASLRAAQGPLHARAPASGRGPAALGRWLVLVGLALGIVGAAVFGRISVGRSEAAASVPAPTSAPSSVEASELRPPRDELPVLLSGEPPRSPEPDRALRPTVIVRLHVDASGAVSHAEVYRPRPELARFEEAALETARRFAFRPARRDGTPVGVWVNWPVDFL
jgi:TonB family protein